MTAIWLESIGSQPALADRQALTGAFDSIAEAGIGEVFLQVYREGRAWFKTPYAGQEHLAQSLKAGFDPIATALALARDRDIRIHAWINVFNLGLNASAKILSELGSKILHTDNRGVRIDEYSDQGTSPREDETFSLDAPKLWLDPASLKVQHYLSNLVRDLMGQYPELSGLHLDFFRYPYCLPLQPSSRVHVGVDFGYGEEGIKTFEDTSSERGAFIRDARGLLRPKNDQISLKWDRWRRSQISLYLQLFRSLLRADQTLSVACLAWPERAFFTAFQNWRSWLSNEQIERACLMSYTADDELFSMLVRQASVFQTKSARLMAGVGAYLLDSETDISRQGSLAIDSGADSVIYFSYENLRKKGVLL